MATFRRHPNGGFLPIFFALMFLSVLAGLSLGVGLQTVVSQKKRVEWLNRVEGYYAGELGAWHHWLRAQEQLSSGDGKYQLALENEPWRGIASASNSGGDPGTPQDVGFTSQFAPIAALVRRYDGSNVTTSRGLVGGSSCGQIRLGANRKSYALCLSPMKVPSLFVSAVVPGDPTNPLGLDNNILTVMGFDRAGALVREWGTNGIIRHRVLGNGDFGNTSIRPMPIVIGTRLLSLDNVGLVALRSDGSLDSSWGDRGIFAIPNGSVQNLYSASEILGGKLLQSYRLNQAKTDVGLTRILDSGREDPTFHPEATLGESSSDRPIWVAFRTLDSGSIRTCTVWTRDYSHGMENDGVVTIRQFTSTGSLDSFFGERGVRSIDLGDMPGVHVPHVFSDGSAAVVHLKPPEVQDGRPVTPLLTEIGRTGELGNRTELGAIFRGAADWDVRNLLSFWDDGFVILSRQSGNEGTIWAYFFNRSGQPDRNMGTNGTTEVLVPSDPRLLPQSLKVVRDSEGSFLFLIELLRLDPDENAMQRDVDRLTLVKLDSRGRLDPSFGDRGHIDIFEPLEVVRSMTPPTVTLVFGNPKN